MESDLLRALVGLVGRQTFPPQRLAEIIGSGKKQLAAFNMCDSTKAQGEIAKALGINTGNFSRTVARLVAEGIVIRLGDAGDAKLLHLYPLPETPKKE
jgi:DNA-binding MarR family transcriptional regulator